MPKTPINYANTCMYKIFKEGETDINNIYIGHTTDFRCRKGTHKSNCNNPKSTEYNTKKSKFIRDNGGWDCFLMRWIEDYPCNSRREAEAREEELRIELGAKLNSIRAFSTPEIAKEQQKQYRKEHAEEIKEQNKQYRKEHTEEIKEQKKQYRKEHPQEIKEQNKQHYKEHAEEIKEYRKEYRKEHAEQIKEYKRQYYLKKKAEKIALQPIS